MIFRNQQCNVRVGSLKDVRFEAGYHIYVSSAQGTGGLKRLYRHVMLSNEGVKKARWHVDHINLDEHFKLVYTIHAFTHNRLECLLAAGLQSKPVNGFGCSDCACKSHLFYRLYDPADEVVKVFRKYGLEPLVEEIL
ncbi:DUF123 domain-containing protein [Methanomethylovorans sp.]|uniref:DUF123 domain-containing protein n=1 Tax=Methanomethylovorans sp. TaxID=2758717 RepID=UPI002FDED684